MQFWIFTIFPFLFHVKIVYSCIPTQQIEEVTACPDGWTPFERVKGLWCIKVFPPSISASQTEAACQSVGGTLTGLENELERLFIHSEAVNFIPNDSKIYFIIGGRRRAPCYGADWLTVPDCIPKKTRSFEWTDGFTSGDAGWAWQTVQPDNVSLKQSYAAIVVATGTRLNDYGIVGNPIGPMDDTASWQTGGYACGRRPVTTRVP